MADKPEIRPRRRKPKRGSPEWDDWQQACGDEAEFQRIQDRCRRTAALLDVLFETTIPAALEKFGAVERPQPWKTEPVPGEAQWAGRFRACLPKREVIVAIPNGAKIVVWEFNPVGTARHSHLMVDLKDSGDCPINTSAIINGLDEIDLPIEQSCSEVQTRLDLIVQAMVACSQNGSGECSDDVRLPFDNCTLCSQLASAARPWRIESRIESRAGQPAV